MASGARPPALPIIRIGTDCFREGRLVSNTPPQHLPDRAGSERPLVLQVNLSRDRRDVLARQKDIQYSSRTRLVTDCFMEKVRLQATISKLLARLADAELSDGERGLKRYFSRLPEVAVLHLRYQQMVYEGQATAHKFRGASLREHWESDYFDTRPKQRHAEWLWTSVNQCGIVVRDGRRAEQRNMHLLHAANRTPVGNLADQKLSSF